VREPPCTRNRGTGCQPVCTRPSAGCAFGPRRQVVAVIATKKPRRDSRSRSNENFWSAALLLHAVPPLFRSSARAGGPPLPLVSLNPHHTNVAVARAVDLPLIFLFGCRILCRFCKGCAAHTLWPSVQARKTPWPPATAFFDLSAASRTGARPIENCGSHRNRGSGA
jgi:hypothetical protein